MKCVNCKYCIQIIWSLGWISNDCLLNLNPGFPEDSKANNEALSVSFAEECKRYKKEKSIFIDYERSKGAMGNYTKSKELKKLILKKYIYQ